jgi:hypothetical protein
MQHDSSHYNMAIMSILCRTVPIVWGIFHTEFCELLYFCLQEAGCHTDNFIIGLVVTVRVEPWNFSVRGKYTNHWITRTNSQNVMYIKHT